MIKRHSKRLISMVLTLIVVFTMTPLSWVTATMAGDAALAAPAAETGVEPLEAGEIGEPPIFADDDSPPQSESGETALENAAIETDDKALGAADIRVDIQDIQRSLEETPDPRCDINGDGFINSADLAVLWAAANYNRAVDPKHPSDVLTYTLSGDVATITGCKDSATTAQVQSALAQLVKTGCTVGAIANYAFQNRTNLTGSLSLPEGLISIGYEAFSGTRLSSVTLPTSLRTTSSYTGNRGPFYNILTLRSVTFAPGTTLIPQYVLGQATSVLDVFVPASVARVANDNAFAGIMEIITIWGEEGSYIQNYAELKGIKFKINT